MQVKDLMYLLGKMDPNSRVDIMWDDFQQELEWNMVAPAEDEDGEFFIISTTNLVEDIK
jgi:hypothetical protein